MTTQTSDGPLTVYLLQGGEKREIADIKDFSLVGEASDTGDAEGEAGSTNSRRARQMRRRRRANLGDISLSLDYNPCDPQHKDLMAAGESDKRLVLHIALNDDSGRPAYAHQVECSVLRYTLSSHRQVRRQSPEPNRPYTLEADLRLQSHGGFRHVPLS